MTRFFCLLLVAITVLPGCAGKSLLQTSKAVIAKPVNFVTGKKPQPPISKIICLWEACEGQGGDGKPARGVAGQIIFFGYGEQAPIKVEGKTCIFMHEGLDEDDPESSVVHKLTIDSGAWEAHRTESTIGHSYNVFVPYTGSRKQNVGCSMRVQFTDEKGRVSTSPFTDVTLVARKSKKPLQALRRGIVENSQIRPEIATTKQESDIQQTSAKKEEADSLNSMTIQMPR